MAESYVFFTKQLKNEYKEAFERIEMYITSSGIDMDTQEEHMSELLDIFLIAQEKGRPVKRIIGDDVESFCKEFCSGLTWKHKLRSMMDEWKWISWVILIPESLYVLILLLDFITGSPVDIWTTNSDWNVTGYLIGLGIAYLVITISNFIILKMMFRLKKVSMIVLKIIKFLAVIGMFFVILFCRQSDMMNLFRVPSVAIWLFCFVYLVIYYTVNHKRLEERRKEKREANHQMHIEMAENIFVKRNEQRVKKGKTALTRSEMLDREERDCNIDERMKYLYFSIPVLGIIITYFIGGFPTIVDFLVFFVIMLIFEVIILGAWKNIKHRVRMRRDWIAEERRKLETDGKE